MTSVPRRQGTDPEVELRVHHFVDGIRAGQHAAVVRTLAPIATDGGRHGVPIATPAEADGLVQQCSDGLARWLALGPVVRARHIERLADAFDLAIMELAEAIADDFQLACADTVVVVRRSNSIMRQALTPAATTTPVLPAGLHVVVTSDQPSGVAFSTLVWPLVVAGSTLVLCPSWAAPRTVTVGAELAAAAGLPDGVLNVVHGDETTIEALASSPLVSGIAGLGPQELTDRVLAIAERHGKRRALVPTGT